MSDLNDDLLNYEIGEVDDNDLTGADEDELLLSDDEIFPEKLSQEEEEHLLSGTAQKVNKEIVEQDNQIEISDNVSVPNTTPIESAASEKSIIINETVAEKISENEVNNVENTETTSTAEDIHSEQEVTLIVENVTEQYSNQVEQSEVVEKETEETNSNENLIENSLIVSEENVVEANNKNDSPNVTENASTFDSQATTLSSQVSTEDSSFNNSTRGDATECDADDSDEVSERQNRRLCSERDPQPPPPQLEQNRSSHQHQFHRGPRPAGIGHMQPGRRFLGPNMQYRVPLGEIPRTQSYNQVPPSGQPPNAMNRHPMPPQFLSGHTIGVMRPYLRMPMRPGMPLPPQNRLPLPHPSHSNQPHGPGPMQQPSRLHGPPFQGPGNPNRPPYPPFNNSGVPPNQPPPLRMQQRPPFGGRPNFMPPNNHPGNMIVHRSQIPLPHQIMHNANVGPGQPPPGPPQPMGRKVLLNPNFKGGVEAATNQLMRDTLSNPQYFAANNEAELLRQQEAFINQNRMHIEKRRRSRERSPDRERSYSPPSRRRPYSPERDSRRPYNSYRAGPNFRGRRANSREHENFQAKKRRSRSFERDIDNADKNNSKTDEDDETRAYRLEIEKQKAMREKILKDKEMRRRRALEDNKTKDEDKKTPDEPQKLTPIIVTAKKIISLKRKSSTSTESPSIPSESQIETKQSPPTAKQAKVIMTVGTRKIPTATILPETKRPEAATTAVVKPVMKKTINIKQSILSKEEEFDEDELLADSPPSSPIKPKVLTKTITGGSGVTMSIAPNVTGPAAGSGIFSTRRVIVRNIDVGNASSDPKQATSEVTKAIQSHKGIFDRLDRKVIGVSEAAKRKIQRIVINNSE